MDPQQRFGAIEAPSFVSHGSAWTPMGCAETSVPRLPDRHIQAARDAPDHRPRSACGSRRSLAVVPLIPDKRYYGETPAGPARATGAVSEGIASGMMIVIRQPQHKGFSVSHWHPGTSVADDVRRLECITSLPGVQIRISGSDGVRSPWCMGVLRQCSKRSSTSASSSACSKTDLRPF